MNLPRHADVLLAVFKDGKARRIYTTISHHIPGLKDDKHQQIILHDYMVENGLLTDYEEWDTRIAPRGYEIATSGGWQTYLQSIDNEHNELVALRREKVRTEERRFKINTGLTVALIILGIYGVYQTDRTRTLESTLREISQTRDSLLQISIDHATLLEVNQTEMRDLNSQLDSLNRIK